MTTTCTYCENDLNNEEIQSPYTDESGDAICDDCHHYQFEFECCLCGDFDHTDIQHYYLIVTDLYKYMHPGIYYIKRGPYFGGPIIGGQLELFNSRLLRLRDLPRNIDTNGYPVGHLCRLCVDKLNIATTSEYRELCGKI